MRTKRKAIIEGGHALIPLGAGAKYGFAVVDIDLAIELEQHYWRTDEKGYVVARKNENYPTRMHHAVVGKPPEGKVTDHINHNKLDNRRSNLRFVTPHQNSQNLSLGKHNTSGVQGVWFNKKRNRWIAEKIFNGVRKTKHFLDKESATKGRLELERSFYDK